MTPIINKRTGHCTEPFNHSQALPPADINPFSSMDIVTQLAMSSLALCLLSSQSCPNNLFQPPHVIQLQPNSSRCLGPKSRVLLKSSLSGTFLHSVLQQILFILPSQYILNRVSSHLLHCYHTGPNYHHLFSGLLQLPPNLTLAFTLAHPQSVLCSEARVILKKGSIRLCHSSAPSSTFSSSFSFESS